MVAQVTGLPRRPLMDYATHDDSAHEMYVADGPHILSPPTQYTIVLLLSALSAAGAGYIVVAFLHAQKWSDPRAARLIFFLGVFNLIWSLAYIGTAASALGRAPMLDCGVMEVLSAVGVNLSMLWSCVLALDLVLRVRRGDDVAWQRWRLERARHVECAYLAATVVLASALTIPHFTSEDAGEDHWRCQLMFGDGVRANRNLAKLAGPCTAFLFNAVALALVARGAARRARTANVAVRSRWQRRMSRFVLVFVATWAARVANLVANAAGAPLGVTRVITLLELLSFPAAGALNALVYGDHPWLRRSCKTCLVFYGCFDRRACCCLRRTDPTFVSVGHEKEVSQPPVQPLPQDQLSPPRPEHEVQGMEGGSASLEDELVDAYAMSARSTDIAVGAGGHADGYAYYDTAY